MRSDDVTECCGTCKYLVDIPTNNRYGDVKYFCLVTGYFTTNIHKNRNKVKRFTPGGKELKCKYERK